MFPFWFAGVFSHEETTIIMEVFFMMYDVEEPITMYLLLNIIQQNRYPHININENH